MLAPTLSRARSPFVPEGGRGSLFRQGPPAIPADALTLRIIRDAVYAVADERVPQVIAHARAHRLRECEHLIGIHVMGYEFNEDERPDSDGDRWKWRTGLGCYTDDPIRPWTRDLSDATHLASWLCPHLRLSLRLGGARNGQVSKAAFSKRHPLPGLAGAAVPLPQRWPAAVREIPAVGVVLAFLEAAAMEKDAAAEAQGRSAA